MVVRESASGGFNSVISASGGDNRLKSETGLRQVWDLSQTPTTRINHK